MTAITTRAGFTLVEVMVAALLIALLSISLTDILTGGKGSQMTINDISTTQKNAHKTLGFIQQQVKVAGYKGCFDPENPNMTHTGSLPGALVDVLIAGAAVNHDELDNWMPDDIDSKAGTDTLIVAYLEPVSDGLDTVSITDASVNSVNLTEPLKTALNVKHRFAISDCRKVHTFNASGADKDSKRLTMSSSTSESFDDLSLLSRITYHGLMVATVSGVDYLLRIDELGNIEPLMTNVVDLDVTQYNSYLEIVMVVDVKGDGTLLKNFTIQTTTRNLL